MPLPAELGLVAALLAAPASAATAESYKALDRKVAQACAAESGFENPRVSPAPIRFSDAIGLDARLVTGRYPQPHMRGAQGLMLCLYRRADGAVEVADAESWWTRRGSGGQ